jgi:hypothetical protein
MNSGETIAFRIVSPIACKITLALITADDILECENEGFNQKGIVASIPSNKLSWIPTEGEADDFIPTVFRNQDTKQLFANDKFLQIYVNVALPSAIISMWENPLFVEYRATSSCPRPCEGMTRSCIYSLVCNSSVNQP